MNLGPRPDYNWEVTPLAIGGKLFFSAGAARAAVAIDGATGDTLWTYHLEEGERANRAPRSNNRGVAYWADENGRGRVLLITLGYQLVALDAETGTPVKDFGTDGIVDLWVGLLEGTGRKVEPGQIGASSPAIVVGDVVVVGAALPAGGAPRTKTNVPAFVRGYSARTGKLLWTFHTIPRPGEFGNDTWKDNSWQYTGNTGVWAPMAADLELGYVYLPVEMPTGDYYGGHRPGDNVFADSLVCLNAKTGERIWHFQVVHHDIWDWDLASQPVLLDVTIEGKPVKVVAQVTKQGFTFVFDRVTGKPIWPIEERPVPASTVPGEVTAPTQPFPTRPLPFDRNSISEDDVNDLTPAVKAEALRIISQYKTGPVYTPSIVQGEGGKLATLIVPHNQGAANWQGAAADPETGFLYVPSETTWWASAMVPGRERNSDMNYVGAYVRVETPLGLPLVKGPWGRITAIDLKTGDHAWMVPNGHAPQYVVDNPAVKDVDLSGMGQPERAPLLVTRTLLFSGDGSGMFSSGPGGGGPLFRALDKATGKTLYEMELPANETGIPMTYLANGKQYIVVAVGRRNFPAELVALALPEAASSR
ncbi:MAG TPA: PQQ-binding-like beta-propeller repeat protein [Terriglobia bacterium]|nr:PQQ-binding-like beta-propeller repeat protein [Terriglobia bacterium]